MIRLTGQSIAIAQKPIHQSAKVAALAIAAVITSLDQYANMAAMLIESIDPWVNAALLARFFWQLVAIQPHRHELPSWPPSLRARMVLGSQQRKY